MRLLCYLASVKQLKTITLMLCCALLLAGFKWAHEYYVSVGEMRLGSSNRLELSLRVFTDDLEYALRQDGYPGVDVLNDPKADSLIDRYLQKHLDFYLNSGTLAWELIGTEGDAEGVFLFVETGPIEPLREAVTVVNSVLTDYFPAQINILHYVTADGEKYSYRFDAEDDRQQILLNIRE